MIKTLIQGKAFKVTVLLYLWMFQVHSYELHKQKATRGIKFEFLCDKKERLESTKPTNYKNNVNETQTVFELTFFYCLPPKKPYLEILKDININASQVSTIEFREMANTELLKESLFEKMPLTYLKINNYTVSIHHPGKLDLAMGYSYNIFCNFNDLNTILRKKALFPNRLLNVSSVTFDCCPVSSASYSDILVFLNVIPASVQKLKLILIPNNMILNTHHFKKLTLRYLFVTYKSIYELDSNIFKETAIDMVSLEQVELKKLQKFRVKEAKLVDGKFVGKWGNCSTLTSLVLSKIDVSEISDDWLKKCNNLTYLSVEDSSLEEVTKILKGAKSLIHLIISRCQILGLTDRFAADAENLKKLTLDEPMLSNISLDAFGALRKLEELEISYTQLRGFDILRAITPLKNLRRLIIDGNRVEDFCGDYHSYDVSTPKGRNIIQGVAIVSLQYSPLSRICFKNWLNLTYLDLSFNKISELDMLGLPVPIKHPLTLDLTGNELERLPKHLIYDATSMNIFKKSQNITIILDWKMECDCEYSRFIIALGQLPQIRLPNAICSSGEHLVDFTGEKFRCDKYSCGDCTCRTSWDDNATIVDCNSMSLFTLPAVWEFPKKMNFNLNFGTKYPADTIWVWNNGEKIVVKKILASTNFISTLPAYKYPNSLIEVDLTNNKISHLSKSALNALFFGGKRQVNLSGNPFVCECETQDMIYALSFYRKQIPDYNSLNCSNRISYLHELSNRSLCLERALSILGISSATLLALAAIMTSLYLRYKLIIKAFLYARGLCLSCVTEEELDADKEYDAFISYSGLDYELVEEELLPGLENDYKLCVHTRDWIPGEMIYTQIFESVEKSRRTVIVLTKNFVGSVWGIVEFRTAYIKALREGRVRVICIVVDDNINDMDLAPDLKAYLKSNTYLEWKDPWFWQKLRYALPHPSVTKQSGLRNENEENRCQEIELASM